MKSNETDPDRLHFGPIAAFSADDVPVPGLTFVAASDETLVVLDGATPATATNDATGIAIESTSSSAFGDYGLQLTAADVAGAKSYVSAYLVKKDGDGLVTHLGNFTREIDLGPAETDPDRLHFGPIAAFSADDVPVPGLTFVADADPAMTEVFVSLDSGEMVPATNDATEIRFGHYDVSGTAAEVASAKSEITYYLIKRDGDGIVTHFGNYTREIGSPGSGDVTAPTITAISPTPGVAPGDPGGFPASASAASTPIVVQISDDVDLEYVLAAIKIYGSDSPSIVEETVYRDAELRGAYLGSAASVSGSTTTLTIRRAGGWGGRFVELGIDAIDASGNKTTATFVYQLPVASVQAAAEIAVEGVEDAALDRLAQQFRSDS